jgi:hypothetical protein
MPVFHAELLDDSAAVKRREKDGRNRGGDWRQVVPAFFLSGCVQSGQ